MAVLCGTEITSWGALFYALPVAAGTIAVDQGWSLTQILGAFTVAQVVAGTLGFWVGRHIDRVGPRALMTLGSLVGAAAMVGVALSGSLIAFYLAWAVAGAAMSATLYAPAFAAITGWTRGDPSRRVRAITAVTLVAGLASTVFAPLTAWLLGPLGWRGTYAVSPASSRRARSRTGPASEPPGLVVDTPARTASATASVTNPVRRSAERTSGSWSPGWPWPASPSPPWSSTWSRC